MSINGVSHHGLRTTRRLLTALSSGHRGPYDGDNTNQQTSSVPSLHRRSVSAGGYHFTPSSSSGASSPSLPLWRRDSTDGSEQRVTRHLSFGIALEAAGSKHNDDTGSHSHSHAPPAPPLGRFAEYLSKNKSKLSQKPFKTAPLETHDAPSTPRPSATAGETGLHAGVKKNSNGREGGKKQTLLERVSSILQRSEVICNTGIAVELALTDDPESQAKALDRFREGVAAGNPSLIFNLGLCHETGKCGVPKDLTLARRCYKEAANMGHSHAQYNLALIYYQTGKRRAACKLFRRAHESGLKEASLAWAMCLMQGKPEDVTEGQQILLRLARAGNAVAAETLIRFKQAPKKTEVAH